MKDDVQNPSDKLEKEVMEFIFGGHCENHNRALKIWNQNPWEAVSLYETAHHPEMLDLPLVLNSKVISTEEAQLDRDLAKFFEQVHVETNERAPEGEYDLGSGEIAYINRFGRVTNPEDLWDDYYDENNQEL